MVVSIGTVAIAYVLSRRFGHKSSVILTSGFAAPVAIVVAAIFFITMMDEPDGPPPGMVLLGNLTISAILAPITSLVSWLTVRIARRSQAGL